MLKFQEDSLNKYLAVSLQVVFLNSNLNLEPHNLRDILKLLKVHIHLHKEELHKATHLQVDKLSQAPILTQHQGLLLGNIKDKLLLKCQVICSLNTLNILNENDEV